MNSMNVLLLGDLEVEFSPKCLSGSGFSLKIIQTILFGAFLVP